MLLVLLLAAAGLLLAPQAAASGALQGLRACAVRVIPALLPFFVVSRMLTALPLPTPGRRADRLFRALFGVRAACLPALLTSDGVHEFIPREIFERSLQSANDIDLYLSQASAPRAGGAGT